MANEKNLKPFKKGDKRASEAGKKSKRKPLDHQWREKLNDYIKDKDITTLDLVYKVLVKEVSKGNIMAIRELLDRSYGKSKQPIEHSVNEGLEDKITELGKLFDKEAK